ncbi:Alpha/Beta hydrolase protein [Apodospora peruviana]|uniref:Alpha/Beta hydrolase protein n=1 Tax=Apodospora peruviana TaxID=516989 RepID=A0AAE0IQV0_9PEZI|nr:Alpha/Beta hydrolase protein [Apodospora peruviana]
MSLFRPSGPKIYPNPLRTVIPGLSKDEVDKLDYKPDAFPGVRDVETPYGTIRVYEWGPMTGQKVLFIHGITTSCQTLGPTAHALVNEKGCRVMLFDLFGRGFSDGVGDLPHDTRLYTSQILLALASSPLAWSGAENAFRVVGYSMGGGVAVHFAVTFPHLVSKLILLAPAGLIRSETFGAGKRWAFTSGLVPKSLLSLLTKRTLQKPIAASTNKRAGSTAKTDMVDASLVEAADPLPGDGMVPLNVQVVRYVRWMLEHHDGFVPAFNSCIRDAPLINQEEAYAKLAVRPKGSTTLILGEQDSMVHPDAYEVDALPLIGGKEHVHWITVPGGHDFPMTHAKETLEALDVDGVW